MAEYNLFHKKVVGKNGKDIVRWYYSYKDKSGKRRQAVCKNCKTKSEAKAYIDSLAPVRFGDALIKDLTKNMFILGSEHYEHRRQLGKSTRTITIATKRRYIELISETFGNIDIRDLEVQDVIDWLKQQPKSGSWKNGYLGALNEVYMWAQWLKVKVEKPDFPRFARISKKADIFSTDEIVSLFRLENFETEDFYTMFLLSLSGGLRLGEARAFRSCQFFSEKQAIVIDGFLDEKQFRRPYNKKGSNEMPRLRVSILPKITCDILHSFIAKTNRKEDELLFRFNGAPIRKEYAETVFERALSKAGIIDPKRKPPINSVLFRKLTPHSLRYTYVTRMRRGLDGETVRKMVGHTALEMTDAYTRAALSESMNALQPAITEADRFFA